MSSRSESSRAAALREGARKEKSLYEDTADEPGTRKRKGKQAQGGKAPKKNKESQEELEPLDIEWLESDLKNSCVTQMPGPEEAKPGSERKKYKPHDPAITDLSNVPRGWTHVDDDIHPE
jgi:hypothetical protein